MDIHNRHSDPKSINKCVVGILANAGSICYNMPRQKRNKSPIGQSKTPERQLWGFLLG